MGIVYADITLRNAEDVVKAKIGYIKEQEIHALSVRAMVDTGAGTLVINEGLMRQLGLEVKGLRRANLANNTQEICKVTGPVEVHWKDRMTVCQALAVPDSPEVLLGVIPFEDMDLIVNPVKHELEGAHGDEILTYIM